MQPGTWPSNAAHRHRVQADSDKTLPLDAYLAGLVAGKATRSNKLGVVASIPIPVVIRYINAFTLGARSVNPSVTIKVVWVNKWYDPGKEREAATAMIARGVDVLMQNTDTSAVVQTALDKGVYVIGWGADMSKMGPKAPLATSILHWGVYYTKVVEEGMQGKWKTGQAWIGLEEGALELPAFNKDLPADMQKRVQSRVQGIVSARGPIFAGPIKDQSGAVRAAEGKSMTDPEKLAMNWYVEGVEGALPK